MLSRVADSLYWMSRYLERAEHTVRMLDVHSSMTLERSGTSEDARWRRLLLALGSTSEGPATDPSTGNSRDLLARLAHDGSNGASVRSCIATARENARQVREEISSEQWLQLNRLYHLVTRDAVPDAPPEEFLSDVLDGLHLFQGVTDTTMSHGEGWQFIQIGRSIERASSIAALLSVYEVGVTTSPGERPAGSHEFLEWVGLLRCCTAFEAYCNVYTADLTESQILEFLLLNKDFPHAVRYSVDRLREALLALEQESGRLAPQELVRVAGRLQAALRFVEIADVLQGGVGDYLQMVMRECRTVHTLLYRDYIHYSVQTALAM